MFFAKRFFEQTFNWKNQTCSNLKIRNFYGDKGREITEDRSKMQLAIHITDIKILNLGGKKNPQGEQKKRDLKKICLWDGKIKFFISEIKLSIH